MTFPSPECCSQTTAEGEAKAADVAARHLAKQLADTRKALAAKQSSACKLQQVCRLHLAGLTESWCAVRCACMLAHCEAG